MNKIFLKCPIIAVGTALAACQTMERWWTDPTAIQYQGNRPQYIYSNTQPGTAIYQNNLPIQSGNNPNYYIDNNNNPDPNANNDNNASHMVVIPKKSINKNSNGTAVPTQAPVVAN